MKKTLYYLMLPAVAIIIANCCPHVNYLERAELASCQCNIDSVSASWGYLQQANDNCKQVVGVDIAQTLVKNAENLFEGFLQNNDLNNAARCLEIIEQIKSFYGKMFFVDECVSENGSDVDSKQEGLLNRRLRLADAYYKEAQSADRLWKKHTDLNEKQRYERAMKRAHKYNPEKY